MTNSVPALRLLIIDDEVLIALNLANLLQEALQTAIIDTAMNHQQAYEFLNRNYDIIICDLKMPSFCGFQFANEIAERKLHSAMIMITGGIPPLLSELPPNTPIKNIITKPIEFETLILLLKDLIRKMETAAA